MRRDRDGHRVEFDQRPIGGHPLITVVVPVYNVEPYVRESLESIRSQTFENWEAIIVDDRSTDGSMRVVSEITATDDRFRVVRLPSNGGLGNARNVGINESSGDYVMMLDSDDYLETFALERVAQVIAESQEPDVVWFDYAREWWWGKRKRNIYGNILATTGPGPTTISEHTALLQILPIAPNKAYRRSYLDSAGFPFPTGLYEDVPFTYPVLLSAASIAIIDEVLYIYRQRRHGNIRRNPTRAHFAILDQYELTFERIGYLGMADEIRGILYRKMLDHLFTVYGMGPGRTPADSREEFFHKASVLANRYATKPDKAPLIGMRRLRLLVDDRFELFRLSMAPTAVSTWFDDSRPDRKKRRSSWKKNRKTAVKRWLYRSMLVRGRLAPNLAVFWVSNGRQPSANPRAIYEELLRERPDLQPLWALSPNAARSLETALPHVVIGSWDCYRALAQATYVVSDTNLPVYFVKRLGTTFLQTLKGTPLETIYTDTRPYAAVSKGTNFGNLLQQTDAWDYCLSSSAYATETIRRAVPSSFDVLEFGQPRNDILFDDIAQIAVSVRKEFNLADDATIVLHAPIKRPWERSDSDRIDLDDLLTHLPNESVVFTTMKQPVGNTSCRVFDISRRNDLERLAAASDMLITDYSPIMFDYAILLRPIIIFADDSETFMAVRGTYFDPLVSPPGAVATSQDELFQVLDSGSFDTDETRRLLGSFRTKYCEFDDGSASARTVQQVFR